MADEEESLEIQISNGFYMAEDEMRSQPAKSLAAFLDVVTKVEKLLLDKDACAAMDRDSLKEVTGYRVKSLSFAAVLQLRSKAVTESIVTLKQLFAVLDARPDGRSDIESTLNKVSAELYALATNAAAVLSADAKSKLPSKLQKTDSKSSASSSSSAAAAAAKPVVAPSADALKSATAEFALAESGYNYLIEHTAIGARDKTHIHHLTYDASWFAMSVELANVYMKRRAYDQVQKIAAALAALLPPPAAQPVAASGDAAAAATAAAAPKDEKMGPKPVIKDNTDQLVTVYALQLRAAKAAGDQKSYDAVLERVIALLPSGSGRPAGSAPGQRGGGAASSTDAKSMALLRQAVGEKHHKDGKFSDAQKSFFAAFVSSQHTSFEKRTVKSLVSLVIAQLLAGNTMNPFNSRQAKVYVSKYKEAKALSDMMLALQERSDKMYADTLKASKDWMMANPLIAPHWTALTQVKPPRDDPSGAPIYFKSVDKKMYENDTCCICCEDLKDATTPVVRLPRCSGHYFHRDCIEGYIKQSKKCPMCGMFYGIVTGSQPDGRMTVSRTGTQLSGHAGCGSIVISFEFPSGTQGAQHPHPGKPYYADSRVAYLPDNAEGKQLLKMYEIGWERKLLFKIGFSETRNQDDLICYNGIHMKSSPSGTHGYPDPTYGKRVKEEFATKGIFEDSTLAKEATAKK